MKKFLAKQFRKPSGIGGRVVEKLMIKGNLKAYEYLYPLMGLSPDMRILEIGYGHGLGIHKIATTVGCEITGIDFSELMFANAFKRNKALIKDKKVQLLTGDFLTTDFETSSFDLVFCINVIYFWSNLNGPFKKVAELLAQSGTFCFYMASRDTLDKIPFTHNSVFNKYLIKDVVECLYSAGFKKVDYSQSKEGYLVKANK